MVPDAIAGKGRRSVQAPPHDKRALRRAVGLEAAVVDNAGMTIPALSADDDRVVEARVAGPAALLVAKLHKLGERQETPDRLMDKDAYDIYRLLVAITTANWPQRSCACSRTSSPVTSQALHWTFSPSCWDRQPASARLWRVAPRTRRRPRRGRGSMRRPGGRPPRRGRSLTHDTRSSDAGGERNKLRPGSGPHAAAPIDCSAGCATNHQRSSSSASTTGATRTAHADLLRQPRNVSGTIASFAAADGLGDPDLGARSRTRSRCGSTATRGQAAGHEGRDRVAPLADGPPPAPTRPGAGDLRSRPVEPSRSCLRLTCAGAVADSGTLVSCPVPKEVFNDR